jgi:hypothetical protein
VVSVREAAPIDLLADALNDLEVAITFAPGVPASSHTIVTVGGMEDPRVPVALGRYLVGALAGAVGVDARLSEQLLARGVDRRAEVARTVTKLVGTTNTFPTPEARQFRDTRRNAWIGEGIGHALLVLSARRETLCVDGRICALTEVHPTPTRQGLDSVSLYLQAAVLGVAIGEGKATHSNAGHGLGDAAQLFVEVEQGVHGPELRAKLGSFRSVLPDHLQDQVKDALWSENASYLPMIVYHTEHDFSRQRPKLAGLNQPQERRRVIVVRLASFHAFFDAVADAMRAAVAEVVV